MESRSTRWWASGLIVAGVALLAVAFVAAFSVARDPGGYYDEWVPSEGPEGPEASFDWSSSSLAVTFADTSAPGEAAIERWLWDFGDGTESPDPSPSHRYGEEGEYTVTLDVVDANGEASQAEATVGLESGGTASGEGALGLNDLADKLTETVEQSAKGGVVVVLVIGMFVVLTMIGGRLLKQGVRALRPIPDRISVKLRPKELELAAAEPLGAASEDAAASDRGRDAAVDEQEERVGAGV